MEGVAPELREIEERVAKTQKGKRYLKQFKPQLNEGARSCLIMKGNKTSPNVQSILDIFYKMRKNVSKKLGKKHQIKPFIEVSSVEFLAERNLCPLFIFGSNSKKKPDRVTIGRIFNKKLLDMVEFHVSSYEEIDNGKGWNSIFLNSCPVALFHGASFEYDEDHKRIKNLLNDIFNRNVYMEEIDIISGTRFIVSVIGDGDDIHLRFYSSLLLPSDIKNKTWTKENCMREIGPRITLTVKRKKFAHRDLYKRSVKYKPYWAEKSKKNIEYSGMGDRRGRVHIQQADLGTLHIRKNKKLLKKRKMEKQAQRAEQMAGAAPEKKLKVADSQ